MGIPGDPGRCQHSVQARILRPCFAEIRLRVYDGRPSCLRRRSSWRLAFEEEQDEPLQTITSFFVECLTRHTCIGYKMSSVCFKHP